MPIADPVTTNHALVEVVLTTMIELFSSPATPPSHITTTSTLSMVVRRLILLD